MLSAWFIGLGLFVFWSQMPMLTDWRTLLGAAAVLSAGTGVFWEIRKNASGLLHWDGRVWQWTTDRLSNQSDVSSLKVVADFQRMLVVQLLLKNRQHVWLCASRCDCPDRWLDFRRAIHLPGKPVPAWVSPGGTSAKAVSATAALEIELDAENLTRSNQ